MRLHATPTLLLAIAATACLTLSGCSDSREDFAADTATANVGKYGPAPANAWKPKIGVIAFKPSGEATKETADIASDQLNTMLTKSDRFTVIERTELDKILAEQGLAGVVAAGEVPAAGKVKGVDLLVIGRITNFRVKEEKKRSGTNVGSLGGFIGVVDVNNSDSTVSVDCGVDLRLIGTTDGANFAAGSGEYKRSDSASSMGLGILGHRTDSEASVKIDKDSQGKILRLALDKAMRDMLEMADPKLAAKGKQP